MDSGELDGLIRAYAPMVYRLAYARTGCRADAEDISQEVFLRLVRTKPAFRDDDHCRAWLLRVAANCANDFFRSPWRRTEPLDEHRNAPAGAAEEGSLLTAVLELPARYRVPVHLYYYEDLSIAEIAQATGRSEAAVKKQLSRARDMLRTALRGGEDHA